MTSTTKNKRDQMPGTAAWIDELRTVFGADEVNGQIRKGMKGEPVFYAKENGHEIGARKSTARAMVAWDDMGRSYSYDIPAGVPFEEAREIERLARIEANIRETCNG